MGYHGLFCHTPSRAQLTGHKFTSCASHISACCGTAIRAQSRLQHRAAADHALITLCCPSMTAASRLQFKLIGKIEACNKPSILRQLLDTVPSPSLADTCMKLAVLAPALITRAPSAGTCHKFEYKFKPNSKLINLSYVQVLQIRDHPVWLLKAQGVQLRLSCRS